jgi:uncharacterized protein YqeY
MRSGDTQRRVTMSGLRAPSNVRNRRCARGGDAWTGSDAEVQAVIEREAKKRATHRRVLESRARRPRRLERAELEILQEFLPQQ